MKSVRYLLSFAYCLLITSFAQGQDANKRWLLGAGITYCSYVDNPGLNLNVSYRLIGNFHIGPDFSALLTKEIQEGGRVVKKKEIEYNFNVQQLFEIGKKTALYPLTGVNFSQVTLHPAGQEPDKRWLTALNVGGGLELRLKKFRLFFETKYVTQLDKLDITGGVMIVL